MAKSFLEHLKCIVAKRQRNKTAIIVDFEWDGNKMNESERAFYFIKSADPLTSVFIVVLTMTRRLIQGNIFCQNN